MCKLGKCASVPHVQLVWTCVSCVQRGTGKPPRSCVRAGLSVHVRVEVPVCPFPTSLSRVCMTLQNARSFSAICFLSASCVRVSECQSARAVALGARARDLAGQLWLRETGGKKLTSGIEWQSQVLHQ